MALFQKSVLQQYLNYQEKEVTEKAYKKYAKYFLNPTIQENIKTLKEEEYQGIFLTELFVNVLGYTLSPKPNYNLVAEYKNQNNSRKADGAILKDETAIAVIELKGTKTKDLESIRRQAFDYKANQKGCVYVITSNFEKLRFYINDATEFLDFDLFELTQQDFELLYLCLSKESIFGDIPQKIKNESVANEEKITKAFYKDYSVFKRELYRDLVKRNGKRLKHAREHEIANDLDNEQLQKEIDRLEKNVKLALFKKSQKLIDRFLFIFFGEDRGLLPPNSTKKILEEWEKLKELNRPEPLYDTFKIYFNYLDKGRQGTNGKAEIYAYNGGLFKPDSILDSLEIDDELLYKHTGKLERYDFDSQIDVNILGHIFENSLNEIESVNAEIEGTDFDKQKSKRKKDGVFYTPKYITKYMVENTIGKLCDEKKNELGFSEEEYFKSRKGRQKATLEKLIATLDEYREWLLELTICDPACGSGAFLNQALDFLINEHNYIDELKTRLLGGGLVLSDIENTILENNIYGVDLNEESVEIAKLSLWLRTAQPRRKLNDLSSNIKCGNSLIESKAVAGDKAFNWQEAFPKVFNKPPKKLYLVTFVTHNSRISDRMVEFNPPGFIKDLKAFYFQGEDYTKMIELIGEGLQKYNIPTVAFTVIPDHVHLLVAANNEKELNEQIRKLKGYTSYEFQRYKKWDKGENHVWAQKFNRIEVPQTLEDIGKVTNYITNNTEKHKDKWGTDLTKKLKPLAGEPLAKESDKGFQPLAKEEKEQPFANETIAYTKGVELLTQLNKQICLPHDKAIKNKGGFDVIIGNPPYVRVQGIKENYSYQTPFYEKTYEVATGRYDIYTLFIEKSYKTLNPNGLVSFILPHNFLISDFGEGVRKFLSKNKAVNEILHFGSEIVFKDASTYTCILTLSYRNKHINYKKISPSEISNELKNFKIDYSQLTEEKWNLQAIVNHSVFNKLNQKTKTVKDVFSNVSRGIVTGADSIFILEGKINGNIFKGYSRELKEEVELEAEIMKPILKGGSFSRYDKLSSNIYILYPHILKEKTEALTSLELSEKYPKAFDYLLNFKEVLIDKKIKYKTNPEIWWSLHNSRDLTLLENKKIITPYLSKRSQMTIDERGDFFTNDKCSLLKIKDDIKHNYLSYLGIFNSSLFWFFIQNTSSEFSGGYFAYTNTFIEPFKLPEYSKELENIVVPVEKQLVLNTSTSKVINAFIHYLKEKIEITVFNKKLQNWHELEFGEFIKELNKAIKKENKERAKSNEQTNGLKPIAGDGALNATPQGASAPCLKPIPVLTKLDEIEWMEVFETKKAEVTQLKSQIEQTDKEIDKMVYELYELTPEEIEIVENS